MLVFLFRALSYILNHHPVHKGYYMPFKCRVNYSCDQMHPHTQLCITVHHIHICVHVYVCMYMCVHAHSKVTPHTYTYHRTQIHHAYSYTYIPLHYYSGELQTCNSIPTMWAQTLVNLSQLRTMKYSDIT